MSARTVAMPAGEPSPFRVSAPQSAGIGLEAPERLADCSGVRPDWFPFQINVCDVDEPAVQVVPTIRHRAVPAAPTSN